MDISSLLGSQGTSVDQLVSMYMAVERRPLDTLKSRRDELDVRTAMFNDLRARIDDVKSAADDLSTTTLSVFGTHTVSSSDSAYATATASSSAANGTYVVDNIVLARADRLQSAQQPSGWTAVGASSFVLNGAVISVADGATLSDVRAAINGATYAAGRGVVATVVNVDSTHSRLILDAQSTGSANAIQLSDQTGTTLADLGYIDANGLLPGVELQTAQDASFTVNGVQISGQPSNTISGAVSGLTVQLNKAGGPVTLTVGADTAAMSTSINAFLDKLNALTDYLATKSAVTKGAGDQYTRGPLNGDMLYTDLKGSLTRDLATAVSGLPAGAPTRLSDLGIQLDSNLHFVVADATKLSNWLSTNPTGVSAFFGGTSGVAKLVSNELSPYVVTSSSGSESYLDMEMDSISYEQSSIDAQTKTLNDRLAIREQTLRNQFTRLQGMMNDAYQEQQRLQSIFSSTSSWG